MLILAYYLLVATSKKYLVYYGIAFVVIYSLLKGLLLGSLNSSLSVTQQNVISIIAAWLALFGLVYVVKRYEKRGADSLGFANWFWPCRDHAFSGNYCLDKRVGS